MATLAAECHSLYYRASVTIGLGFFYSFAIVTLPSGYKISFHFFFLQGFYI